MYFVPVFYKYADDFIYIHQDTEAENILCRTIYKRRISNMKNKMVKALVLAMALTTVSVMGSASIYASETETAEAAAESLRSLKPEKQKMRQMAPRAVRMRIRKLLIMWLH